MIRLTVVTLAALYAVLYYFGDDARRPEDVSRGEAPSLGMTLARYLPELPDRDGALTAASAVSENEAIRLALTAGVEARAGRQGKLRSGAVVEAKSDAAAPLWYVTGERVNLRQGPGTSNPVVGQAVLGDAAEVLDDRDGWYRIRLSDGSATGWIFGQFLDDRQPG